MDINAESSSFITHLKTTLTEQEIKQIIKKFFLDNFILCMEDFEDDRIKNINAAELVSRLCSAQRRPNLYRLKRKILKFLTRSNALH
jgi:hypothetical protein